MMMTKLDERRLLADSLTCCELPSTSVGREENEKATKKGRKKERKMSHRKSSLEVRTLATKLISWDADTGSLISPSCNGKEVADASRLLVAKRRASCYNHNPIGRKTRREIDGPQIDELHNSLLFRGRPTRHRGEGGLSVLNSNCSYQDNTSKIGYSILLTLLLVLSLSSSQENNFQVGVKIRWLAPSGLDVVEDKSQRVHTESAGQHGSRLVIMNATTSTDDGQYKCILGSASDKGRKEVANFTVRVHQSPSFPDSEPLIQQQEGRAATISCRINFDTNMSLSVSWLKDSMELQPSRDTAYKEIEYDPERRQAQLQVSPVARRHDGVYTCRAMVYNSDVSKVSDHNTRFEVQYAPTFERSAETIWVERASSRTAPNSQTTSASGEPNYQGHSSGQRHHNSMTSGRLRSDNKQSVGNRYTASGSHESADPSSSLGSLHNASGLIASPGNGKIRVELRCVCSANPAASIVWTSSSNSNFVLAKDQPAHVVEEPTSQQSGQLTISTLVVEYQLDSEWPHKRDQYICSASNHFGSASKRFDIEQGDPAPALTVAPQRYYNPLNAQFNFTLTGIQLEIETQSLIPPVDSLRIRTQDFKQSESFGLNGNSKQRQSGKSIELQLEPVLTSVRDLAFARNLNVSLAGLPSGPQKLYLEAHNAVGWSGQSTYLGEFNLINGASSRSEQLLGLSISIFLQLLMASYLVNLNLIWWIR